MEAAWLRYPAAQTDPSVGEGGVCGPANKMRPNEQAHFHSKPWGAKSHPAATPQLIVRRIVWEWRECAVDLPSINSAHCGMAKNSRS